MTKIDTTDIDLLIGVDTIHGAKHLIGGVLWPHNIGLAAARNLKHF